MSTFFFFFLNRKDHCIKHKRGSPREFTQQGNQLAHQPGAVVWTNLLFVKGKVNTILKGQKKPIIYIVYSTLHHPCRTIGLVIKTEILKLS